MAVMPRHIRFQAAPIHAARRRRSRFPWYFEMDSAALFMAGVTLLSLTCLLYLLQTSRVAVLGYEIQQVQAQQAAAARETESLTYELDRLKSLAMVEQHARTELGMKRVSKYEYVRMPVSPTELRAERGSRAEETEEGR